MISSYVKILNYIQAIGLSSANFNISISKSVIAFTRADFEEVKTCLECVLRASNNFQAPIRAGMSLQTLAGRDQS